jgi:hypothetical protein
MHMVAFILLGEMIVFADGGVFNLDAAMRRK